jgi:hypothetical protein
MTTLFGTGEKLERSELLGEDTWELFEAVEASFCVDLGDYEVLCGRSIKELAEEINERAKFPTKEKCLSAVSFYKLRRTFGALFNIPRSAIRPSTSLRELLPWRSRRSRWRQIEKHLGLRLPRLAYPTWALVLSLFAPAALLIVLKLSFGLPLNPIVIFLLSLSLAIPAIVAFSPFARVIPCEEPTLGGLAKVILAKNYSAFASGQGGSSASDMLSALQQLVATQTGRRLDEISPEARIPQDLNIY